MTDARRHRTHRRAPEHLVNPTLLVTAALALGGSACAAGSSGGMVGSSGGSGGSENTSGAGGSGSTSSGTTTSTSNATSTSASTSTSAASTSASASSSTGGSEMCGPGEMLCSGACVDLKTDPANCGSCGKSCSGSDQCVNGACASPVCPPSSASLDPAKTIPDPNASMLVTRVGIAWDGKTYWTVSGGSPTVTLFQSDANGNQLGSYTSLDFRSLFVVNGTYYARPWNSPTIKRMTADLGVFEDHVTLQGGALVDQTGVSMNGAGEFVALVGALSRFDRWDANNGKFIGSVHLSGFGLCPGEASSYKADRGVAAGDKYYTYNKGTVSEWNASGTRLRVVTLNNVGSGASFDHEWTLSYANGLLWMVDFPGGTWRGYAVPK